MGKGIDVQALRGVDLTVSEGEFVALIGASGSGKSSLLHILGFMDRPTRGDILWNGRVVNGMPDGQRTVIRCREVGFVFQTFNLLPTLTAAENAAIPMRFAGVAKAEQRKRALEVLEKVGLGHRARHLPKELSGGE